jgi:hypothetical protein
VGDLTPTRKVAAGGVAGAATVILVWLAGMFGLEMPPEVAAALTVLLGTGAAYLRTERPR